MVATPSARVMPETPSGRSSVDSVRLTPLVVASVVAAAASTSSGVCPRSPASSPSPEHAASGARRPGPCAVRTAYESAAGHGAGHAISLPHRRSRRRADLRRRRPRVPPATPRRSAAAAGMPEPSRRPVASGRSTGAPLAAAARAGAGPAQAVSRVSSPLRKRWQRTPPVARPLAGYSREGGHLDRPGLGAGQGRRGAAGGHHDRVGRRRGRRRTRPARPRVHPHPGDAAAGAALRADAVGTVSAAAARRW